MHMLGGKSWNSAFLVLCLQGGDVRAEEQAQLDEEDKVDEALTDAVSDD